MLHIFYLPYCYPDDPTSSLGVADQLSSSPRAQSSGPETSRGRGDKGRGGKGRGQEAEGKKERLVDVVLSDYEGEYGPRTSSPDRGKENQS